MHPYHVTARTNNRETFKVPLDVAWDIFLTHCSEMICLFGVKIHAFVMMPNHYHLLMTTPREDLGDVMMRFMASVTRTLNLNSGRSGRVFSGRYHWCLVHSDIYYSHVLKYIYRNPIRGKLCEAAEDYQYSTLKGLVGQSHLAFPLFYPQGNGLYVPTDHDSLLSWINAPTNLENQEAIRKALRKLEFKLPLDRRNWNCHPLERSQS